MSATSAVGGLGNTRMKVLLLTQSYLPVMGGLQQIVHDLARGLAANGDSVQVAAKRYPIALRAQEQIDTIPVQRLFFFSPGRSDLRQGRVDLFGFSLMVAPFVRRQMARLVQQFAPDVIHFHYPQHLIPFVWPVIKHSPTRLIVSFHGVEIDEAQHGIASEQVGLHRLLDRANWVTAVSRDTLAQVTAFHPTIAPKSAVVYNGLHEEAFILAAPHEQYGHSRPYILGVGRLVQPKGFDLLIDAFSRIAIDHPQIDLLIVGNGEARSALTKQAICAGVGSRVIFLGNRPRGDVTRLLRGCYFLVIPSRAETFGLVALEGMAQERRVLATCVGGLPELLDGGDNRLVEVTAEALNAAIAHWLIDPSFTPHSIRNRQRALQFTMQRMVNGYRQLYT